MYARIENDVVVEYPYTLQQLQAAHPMVSLALPATAASLAPFGVVPVEEVPRPVEAAIYDIVEGLPVSNNGVWKQTWEQVLKPLQEIKAGKLAQLEQARDTATVQNVTVQGKVFSAAPGIQTAFKRVADRMRRGRPTTLQAVLDVTGAPVSPVTQALLDGIEDAIAANTEAAWNNYVVKVGQVAAAETPEAVNAIVW